MVNGQIKIGKLGAPTRQFLARQQVTQPRALTPEQTEERQKEFIERSREQRGKEAIKLFEKQISILQQKKIGASSQLKERLDAQILSINQEKGTAATGRFKPIEILRFALRRGVRPLERQEARVSARESLRSQISRSEGLERKFLRQGLNPQEARSAASREARELIGKVQTGKIEVVEAQRLTPQTRKVLGVKIITQQQVSRLPSSQRDVLKTQIEQELQQNFPSLEFALVERERVTGEPITPIILRQTLRPLRVTPTVQVIPRGQSTVNDLQSRSTESNIVGGDSFKTRLIEGTFVDQFQQRVRGNLSNLKQRLEERKRISKERLKVSGKKIGREAQIFSFGREFVEESEREKRLTLQQNKEIDILNKDVDEFNLLFGGRELSQSEFIQARTFQSSLDQRILQVQIRESEIERIQQQREQGELLGGVSAFPFVVGTKAVLDKPFVVGGKSFSLGEIAKLPIEQVERAAKQFSDEQILGARTLSGLVRSFGGEPSPALKRLPDVLEKELPIIKTRPLELGAELAFFAVPTLGAVALTSAGVRGFTEFADPTKELGERISGAAELGVVSAIGGVVVARKTRKALTESLIIRESLPQTDFKVQDIIVSTIKEASEPEDLVRFALVGERPPRKVFIKTRGEIIKEKLLKKAFDTGDVELFGRTLTLDKGQVSLTLLPKGKVRRGVFVEPAFAVTIKQAERKSPVFITTLEGGFAPQRITVTRITDLPLDTQRRLQQAATIKAGRPVSVENSLKILGKKGKIELELGGVVATAEFRVTKKGITITRKGRKVSRAELLGITKEIELPRRFEGAILGERIDVPLEAPRQLIFTKLSGIPQRNVKIQTREQFERIRIDVQRKIGTPEVETGLFGDVIIEPQVSTAVRILNRKGFVTGSSGFFPRGKVGLQTIEVKGTLSASEIVAIKKVGGEVEIGFQGRFTIVISQSGKSLSQVKTIFDRIARQIPIRKKPPTVKVGKFIPKEDIELFETLTTVTDVTFPKLKTASKTPSVIRGKTVRVELRVPSEDVFTFKKFTKGTRKTLQKQTSQDTISLLRQAQAGIIRQFPKPRKLGRKRIIQRLRKEGVLSEEARINKLPKIVGGLGLGVSKFAGTGLFERTEGLAVIPSARIKPPISKPILRVTTLSAETPKLDISVKQLSRQLTKQVSRLVPREIARETTRLIPREITKETTRLTSRLLSRLVTKQVAKTPTLLRPIKPRVRLKPLRGKLLLGLPKRSKEEEELLSQGFLTFVIKGGKEVVLPKVRARGEALRLGAKRVRETLRATFGIKATDIKVPKGSLDFRPSKVIFRPFRRRKGKIIPLQDTFIERRKFRLDVPSEVAEIKAAARSKLNV